MQDRPGPNAAELMGVHHQLVVRGSSVAEAARLIASSGLPMVPVCELDGRLAGVVTFRSLLAGVGSDPAWAGRPVEKIMQDPVFVAGYASVEWILVEMGDAHTWVLPVTDEHQHLMGVIKLTDLAAVVFPALLARTWHEIAAGAGGR